MAAERDGFLHGSESKLQRVYLRKDGANVAQWLRQYQNAGMKYGRTRFHLSSMNIGVTLSESRHLDNATGDAKELIEEIIRAAKATGLVPDTYNHD